jgi:hypothetical protein
MNVKVDLKRFSMELLTPRNPSTEVSNIPVLRIQTPLPLVANDGDVLQIRAMVDYRGETHTADFELTVNSKRQEVSRVQILCRPVVGTPVPEMFFTTNDGLGVRTTKLGDQNEHHFQFSLCFGRRR